MASWSQWSSLLSTNPDPNAFNGRATRKKYTGSAPPSAAASIRSFMSVFSDELSGTPITWGSGKGKLKKQRRVSPPPKLLPLSFSAFDANSIASPSSLKTPPGSRKSDQKNDKFHEINVQHDGHIFSHPTDLSYSNSSPLYSQLSSTAASTSSTRGEPNPTIARSASFRHPKVSLIPEIITTPSTPTTPESSPVLDKLSKTSSTAGSSNRLTKKRSAPSRLPSPLTIPPVPPLKLPKNVLASTEVSACSAAGSSLTSKAISQSSSTSTIIISSSTPSSAHQASAIRDKMPKNTESRSLPILSLAPALHHAPHSDHSHSTHSSELSPSVSTPATSLPASASLEQSDFLISDENTLVHARQVHEAQSDCGHGSGFIPGKRVSLLRNLSFSVGMSSRSPSGSTSSGKSKSTASTGLARSKSTAVRHSRKKIDSYPPPPTSWAEFSSPFPSEGTSISGHTGSTSGGVFSSPSSPTSGGGGWPANTSTSDLSSTFARWRKWRKRGRSSTNGSSQSAFSSRTSFGVEDDPRLPIPSSGEMGEEKEFVQTEDVKPQDEQTIDLSCSTTERPGHKKSTSISGAAASIFRGGGSRNSNVSSSISLNADSSLSKAGPQKISESTGHGNVGIVNGRRVLRKERVVDLDVESEQPRRPKALFTIGTDPSDPPSLSLEDDQPNTAVPAASSPRPPLVRRTALMHEATHIGRRRWTLADAMTDEGISDAGLVRELERMREVAEWARRRERTQKGQDDSSTGQDEDWDGWDEWDVGREIMEGRDVMEMERQRDKEREKSRRTLENQAPLTDSPESEVPPQISNEGVPQTTSLGPRSISSPSTSWLMAQRALLICRELILTERHYLLQLSALVKQETKTTPPPLMVHYATEIFETVSAMLKDIEREPSARGVARSFLEREADLESVYLRWCSVVGSWFSDDAQSTSPRGSIDLDRSAKKRSRGHSKAETEGNNESHGEHAEDDFPKPLKRTISTWRKSMSSISSMVDNGGSVYGPHTKDEQNLFVKGPTVRELAILPTQRVMRYVLLYRDLLANTPSSSASRSLVERAVGAACRIADKCDSAQDNTAFIMSVSSSPLSSASRSSSKHRLARPSSTTKSSPQAAGRGPSSFVTSHTPPPTTSPILSPPPTYTNLNWRSPAFTESSPSHGSISSRRLSTTAMSFVTLGWNKNHPESHFGTVGAVPVAAVAHT